MRFFVRVVVSAFSLWLVTLILAPHVWMTPFAPGGTLEVVLTYLLVAVIVGIVNGIVGTAIRIVAFPIYLLTLGLVSFLVNGLLLLLVAWLSNLFGSGLHIEGFWWGVLAAFLLGVFSWIINLLLRPFVKERSH